MITEKQLQEWQALCDAATPEEWTFEPEEEFQDDYLSPPYCEPATVKIGEDNITVVYTDNAAFIAASRTAVPELIAEVRRLNELVNKMKECYTCKYADIERYDGDPCETCIYNELNNWEYCDGNE